MTLPSNLLALTADLAAGWAAAAGVPVLYAGAASADLGGVVLYLDAPTLEFDPRGGADGPSSVRLYAYLVAYSPGPEAVSDLYARAIPVWAAIPQGWECLEAAPASWPPGSDGAPAYRYSLTY